MAAQLRAARPPFDPLVWAGRFPVTLYPTLAAFMRAGTFGRAVIGPMAGFRKYAAASYIRLLAGQYAEGLKPPREPHQQRQWRWLIVAPRHGDHTALGTWKRLLGDAAEWSKAGIPACGICYKNAPGKPELELVFLDWQNPQHAARLAQGRCSGVWLSEARELPEAAFETAVSAVANYWPTAADRTGPPKKQILVTSRMPSLDHWIPRRFSDGHADYRLFRQPGGLSPQAEKRHLRAGYYEDEAKGMPAEWVRVQIEAEYGRSSGDPIATEIDPSRVALAVLNVLNRPAEADPVARALLEAIGTAEPVISG